MNQLVSLLRRVITVFLVVLAIFVSIDLTVNQLQAKAEPVTPEAVEYQNRTNAEKIQENAEKSANLLKEEGIKVTNRAAESAKDPDKNLLDSIREKLNLDEPIDPGTKKFGEQIKDAASETVKAPQRALEDASK